MDQRSFALSAALGILLLGPAHAEVAQTRLAITISGIKPVKGVVRLALCPQQADFPDCGAKAVRTATVPVSGGTAQIELTGLAPGTYAVSAFHDANANGKLDTLAGIPREGYGFSRNPGFKPRKPKFAEAQIAVAGQTSITIKLRYLM